MKIKFLVGALILFAAHDLQAQKTFTQKLEGIKTNSKELTKNAQTDNSSIGQAGAVSTGVSLVEVKSRGMSFPLELQYKSGIGVSQQSGDVGLGWSMPLGKIVRDYGAFEPDYTSLSGELGMNGVGSWLNSCAECTAINPTAHNQVFQYDGVKNNGFGLNDEYHVSIPGAFSNTFWNQADMNQPQNWVFSDFEKYRVEFERKTFQISQEFSRINELRLFATDAMLIEKDEFYREDPMTAAIGVLPYVINGKAVMPSSNNPSGNQLYVYYEDFEKFIITDNSGYRYVFGRPLRGQKYVFNDDPYWTSTPVPNAANSADGNFWKIDYIAEWLLTEILSPDYEDVNGNGKADDGDNGDWIRFEYTQPTKSEQTTFYGLGHNKMSQEVPTHRSWSNFSQTDRASSLMQEMAYLTKIITPVQEIDLTISQRFEVDHDYYSKPANKVGDSHFFEDRQYTSSGIGQGTPNDFDILYPVETMKYDRIDIKSRFFDEQLYPTANNMQGSVVLNYAEKGSDQELAVSNFLIRNNINQDRLLDKPSTNSFSIQNYYTGTGRGKTTLLGVSFYDSKFDEATKTSYEFEYGYNPKYNEIHKREIARKYFFPSLRQARHDLGLMPDLKHESLTSYEELTLNSDGIGIVIGGHVLYPFEFLIDFPYMERYKKYDGLDFSEMQDFVVNSTSPAENFYYQEIAHHLKPVMDVYGYLYAENCSKCPEAWSLTKITYPNGGIVSFEYEQGEFEKGDDNEGWSIQENGIPMIKDYNDLAEERSAKQDVYNQYVEISDFFPKPIPVRKELTASFRVDLPEKYGIRLKKKTVDDRLNIPVETDYQYQNGHFTALPSEYLANYINGFNSFIMHEKFRHEYEHGRYAPEFETDVNDEVEFWTTDYDMKMRYSVYTGLELDDYTSTHFYENIDEKRFDGSFTRNRYGLSSGEMELFLKYNVYATRLPDAGAEGRFIIGGSSFYADNITLIKTEYFEADATQAYKSEEYFYADSPDLINSRELEFRYSTVPLDNKVVLWDETFEFYLPLYGAVTSNFYHDIGIEVGPMYPTNVIHTADLAFHRYGENEGEHYIRSWAELLLTQELHSYSKWTTGKRLLLKKITTYKGLVTTNDYTYDDTDFNIMEEAISSTSSPEKRITTYEYAHENYAGLSGKFQDLNLRTYQTRITTYLNTVSNSTVLSATAVTYDVNLDVPKVKNTHTYETSIDPLTGVFNVIPFSFTSLSNPNWKISENENHDFNKNGELISTRTNRLYTKTVTGYNRNLNKASFSSPGGFFDATYSGFEDLEGRKYIGDWTTESYKNETWYSQRPSETEFEAQSHIFSYNPCGYEIPPNPVSESRHYNMISMDDVTGLAVGDEVEIQLTPTQYASTDGLDNYSYTSIRTITAIIDKSAMSYYDDENPTWIASKQFVFCFIEPVQFPKSTMTLSVNGTISGEEEVPCVGPVEPGYHCYWDEGAQHTIAETKIIKQNKETVLSDHARTGSYSYRLPTIRNDEGAKTTPIRPVKIEAELNLPAACAGSGPYPATCYKNYEASVWLNMKTDIAESQTANSDLTNYLRGTTSTLASANQGVKIICKVWNIDRTVVLDTRTFYPQSLAANWKKYTVQVPVLKAANNQWLEVYVENNITQINAPITQRKSLYVDDILVYPQDAKYAYSIYDHFGNVTFQVDNNDVFTEKVYDDKGRDLVQKNAYGRIIAENEYFEHADWSLSNNHITTRTWVKNGSFNEKRVYLDGFGKTKQTMVSDKIRNVRIVNETYNYDPGGRVKRSYNPYYLSSSKLGQKYDPNAQANTEDIYNSAFAYSEVRFERVPEDKIDAYKLPHYSNQLNDFKSQRDYLSTADVVHPHLSTVYPAGSLLVYELTNEMGHVAKTYQDYMGRVILEEREIGYEHTQNADGSIAIGDQDYSVSKTWFRYDGAGRLIRVDDPDGKKTEYVYNSLGQILRTVSPDKGASDMRYDRFGQLRFVRDSKDISATADSPYNTDQFNYTKYDAWGRVNENGVVRSMMNHVQGTPPFIASNVGIFNNSTVINNLDFPNAQSYLTEVHSRFEFDGSRDQYDSDQLLREFKYSDHVLQSSVYRYVVGKTDQKTYFYHPDQLPKKVEYLYSNLNGIHTIEYTYNSHRLPIGKRYIHPTTAAFNFTWVDDIDDLGRVTISKTIHNGVQKQVNKNYYDALGNLFMSGLGATGLANDPHLDYVYYRKDVKGRLVNQQSEQFRFALTYDKIGSITRNVWSNERFDPTNDPLNVHLNVYDYTYDRMNRLIGADYRDATLIENPFASFDALKSNIPPDFECTWTIPAHGGDPIGKELGHLQGNLDGHVLEHESRKAINSLNIIEREYGKLETAFHEKSEIEQKQFLQQLIVENKKAKEDVLAYEYVKSVELDDQVHLAEIEKEKNPKVEQLKYMKELIVKHSKGGIKTCVPNDNATVYGILPAFSSNRDFSNGHFYKYDAAYWYSGNGNMKQLNRNDNAGVKTRQSYYYQNPLNNRLTQVSWVIGNNPGFSTSYNYDQTGNLQKDLRNNVTEITYSPYFELPLAITTSTGTKKYRYDNGMNRSVKEISSTDMEFYIDAVVLDQDGRVKSYQTQSGYAVPSGNQVNHFYYVKDHLGTNRMVIQDNGTLVNAADHYPYGKRMPGRFYVSDNEGNRYQFTGHEFDGETGYEYHGARYYNEELGRYMSVDPWADKYASWSTYNYVMGNPLIFTDPTGRGVESTHIDANGKVIAVIEDGDHGVYQHGDNADGSKPTEYMIKRRQEKWGTAAHGTKIGETEYLDEFVNPKSKEAEGYIMVGKSWDKAIEAIHNLTVSTLNLYQIAEESKNFQDLDIKTNKDFAPHGPMTGALLDGNYVTARSAGNVLAGMNGRHGTIAGGHISQTKYMMLAGALNNDLYSKTTAAGIVSGAIEPKYWPWPAPYYGEDAYSGRQIINGWNK